LAYAYPVLVLLALLVMRFAGEHWWPATMLLFGPRWFAAVPLLILLPLAAFNNYRLLIPLFLGALIVSGPFMGLNLGIGKPGNVGTPVIRIITCNIDSGSFNADAFSSFIKEASADIVALQESPREVRSMFKLPSGWNSIQDGELAVFARFPLKQGKTYETMHPPHKWPRTSLLECIIQAPGGDLAFYTLHLPSPRYGLQHVLDRRTVISLSRKNLLDSETVNRWGSAREIQNIIASQPLPVIVAGDFNMPVESSIYREVWKGYTNSFSKTGSGYGWSERASVLGIPLSVRIDHVLTGKGLTPRLCEVGPDVGSDHLPVIADVGR
jgi:endonuclease/exonuclease/phosphatase family metal-dependent hydrolase